MLDEKKFAERLNRREIVVIPGIYDPLSALLAERGGAEALFLSGSAAAYTQLGRPDIGLMTMSEMVDLCARITDRVRTPLLVDVDAGFGNARHAMRTMRSFERAGACGVQVEDQLPIKPASAIGMRPLLDVFEMQDKIKAMVDARHNDSVLISARTDSPFSEPFDTTLERLVGYKESGADILFAEGLKTIEHVQTVVDAVSPSPVLYNLLSDDSELTSAHELENIGVSIALFPSNAVLAVCAALQDSFTTLLNNPKLSTKQLPLQPAELLKWLDGNNDVSWR